MALRSDEVREIKSRFYVLALVAAIGFATVVAKLYELQIKRGEEFSLKSEQNFVQRTRLVADRGLLYDVKGRLLVDNRPALDLYATPAFIANIEGALHNLEEPLELDEDEINAIIKRLRGARKLERFQAMLIRRDLNRDQLEYIESAHMMGKLVGFDIVDSGVRDYRYGKLLAHVTGYLNEIGPQEYEQKRSLEDNTYELGDFIGRRGLERTFESYLRGKDGYDRVVVDAKGRKQPERVARELLGNDRKVPSTPGKNLVLSIDLDVQRAAEQAFTGRAGAVIAVDVRSGFIIAMYSSPAYDPNLVTGRIAVKDKEQLDNDPLKPWVNRAIQEHYPPGSTYKPFTAITALRTGALTPETTITCPGYYKYGGHTWRCFNERGDGPLQLHRAIVKSCDAFFFNLGQRIGIDPLAETAHEFGLGKKTDIALDQEIPGIIPDSAFYDARFGAGSGKKGAFAINAAVGQGDNDLTPLQSVMAYAAIANGGTLYQPQLVKRVEDAEGRVVKTFEPVVKNHIELKDEYWDAIRSALCGVVNEPGGTTYGHRQPDLTVCGKTGTAQVAALKKRVKGNNWTGVDFELRDNAWFVGFAPGEDPQIAVVTLTEHGGFGASASAPPVMAVMRAYLKGEYPGHDNPYYVRDEDLVGKDTGKPQIHPPEQNGSPN